MGIILGRHSYCYGVQRGEANDVIVGAFTSIAEGVIFDGGFNHDTSLISTYPFSSIWSELPSNIRVNGDIRIGSDVWIGEGAIIMSGVTIEDGAVIGARTIVTHNVGRYAVVVGAPMQTIRHRYDVTETLQLCKIGWWNWPDEKIYENIDLLQSGNIHEFIKLHYEQN